MPQTGHKAPDSMSPSRRAGGRAQARSLTVIPFQGNQPTNPPPPQMCRVRVSNFFTSLNHACHPPELGDLNLESVRSSTATAPASLEWVDVGKPNEVVRAASVHVRGSPSRPTNGGGPGVVTVHVLLPDLGTDEGRPHEADGVVVSVGGSTEERREYGRGLLRIQDLILKSRGRILATRSSCCCCFHLNFQARGVVASSVAAVNLRLGLPRSSTEREASPAEAPEEHRRVTAAAVPARASSYSAAAATADAPSAGGEAGAPNSSSGGTSRARAHVIERQHPASSQAIVGTPLGHEGRPRARRERRHEGRRHPGGVNDMAGGGGGSGSGFSGLLFDGEGAALAQPRLYRSGAEGGKERRGIASV